MGTYRFTFPELGEGIHEGKIVRWMIHEGEWVREDEPLAEVENDKALVEVPSPVSGTVAKLFIPEGQTVTVGEPLVNFTTETEQSGPAPAVPKTPLEDAGLKNVAKAVANETTVPANPGRKEPMSAQPVSAQKDVLATPAVRKLAREQHVRLEDVTGTGEHGKITRADIEAFLTPQIREFKPQSAVASSDEERVSLTGVRKAIATAMVKSFYTAPQVTMMDEVDVTELMALRTELQPIAAKRGIKLTYMPFLAKAFLAALKHYPYLNAELDEERDEVILKRHYHIGIATDTERGLLVPVVRNVDRTSIWELAKTITDLAMRGRVGKLQAEEMKGSTASISNVGSAQGLFFTPILNYPEVAILGVGRIREQLARRDGELVTTHMLALSLSFDHRVVDGMTAQLALNVMKDVLAKPQHMLMEV